MQSLTILSLRGPVKKKKKKKLIKKKIKIGHYNDPSYHMQEQLRFAYHQQMSKITAAYLFGSQFVHIVQQTSLVVHDARSYSVYLLIPPLLYLCIDSSIHINVLTIGSCLPISSSSVLSLNQCCSHTLMQSLLLILQTQQCTQACNPYNVDNAIILVQIAISQAVHHYCGEQSERIAGHVSDQGSEEVMHIMPVL